MSTFREESFATSNDHFLTFRRRHPQLSKGNFSLAKNASPLRLRHVMHQRFRFVVLCRAHPGVLIIVILELTRSGAARAELGDLSSTSAPGRLERRAVELANLLRRPSRSSCIRRRKQNGRSGGWSIGSGGVFAVRVESLGPCRSIGGSYPVKTHLHDEEDPAEARGESDNGGDGNRHGLAVELGELRELDAGGGDDRFAAARGAQSDASGCASGAGQANGLAGAARAPGEGGDAARGTTVDARSRPSRWVFLRSRTVGRRGE